MSEPHQGHESDAYARAGVDYGLIDPGKRTAQAAAARTGALLGARALRELAETRGESAYVIDLGDRLLSTVTEALGTKNLVADAVRPITGRTHYDDIAQDTVATILNDLATVGGAPVCLTAYWASGTSEWFADTARMEDLVRGWERACTLAGCAWGGGETQTITGIVLPNAVTLGGSAVGLIAPKDRLLLGSRVAAGDAILIAPATGIHANGLTLARKVVETLPRGYATVVAGDPRGRGIGEVLLDPAPLYGPLVEAVQGAGVELHYAVHVTGHGWRKLMRAERELSYVVETLPPVPPIFAVLQSGAELSDADAFGTFNMGAGFALYLPESQAAAAIQAAKAAGFDLLHAGAVEAGPRRVVLRPRGITFEGASLQIR